MTLAAKVTVPFWPVPMTLQSLAVPFIALTLESQQGKATVLACLLAVPLAVWIAGKSRFHPDHDSLMGGVARALTCNAIVLLIGTVWLAWVARLGIAGSFGWVRAAQFGLRPFVLGDLCKALLAALLAVVLTQPPRSST